MLKKILLFIIGILAVLFSFICLYNNNSKYLYHKANEQYAIDDKFSNISIPSDLMYAQNYDKLVKTLNKTSEQTNLNYLKVQVYDSYEIKKHKYDYNRSICSLTYQVHTINDSAIWSLFGQNKAKVTRQVKHLAPDIKGYSVTVEPINMDSGSLNRQGSFYLETKDKATYQNFLKYFASNLNQEFQTKYTASEFYVKKDFEKKQLAIEFSDLSTVQFVTLFLIFAFTLFYVLLSTKQLSVFNLEGYSYFKANNALNLRLILVSGAGSLLLASYLFLFGNYHIGPKSIFEIFLLYVFIYVFAYGITKLVGSFSFNNQLKSNNYLKWWFLFGYAAKASAMIITISSLLPLVQLGFATYTALNASDYSSKKIGNEYAVVYPHMNGLDNPNDLDQSIQEIDDKLYTPLVKSGAILFDDDAFQGPNKSVEDKYKQINVNPNYLRRFQIRDVNHNKIDISDSETKGGLLVPVSNKKYVPTLKEQITSTNEQDGIKANGFKIIYIPDKGRYLNLRSGKSELNQTMFVSTKQNSGMTYRNILNGQGVEDGLKIQINGSASATFENISQILDKYNFGDNYAQVVKLNDVYKEDLYQTIGDVKQSILLILVTLIVILGMSMYLTQLYMSNHQKELYVKFVDGFSTCRMYRQLWGLFALQYIGIFGLMLMNAQLNGAIAYALLMIMSMELICILATIHKMKQSFISGDIQ